jgi:hypothetical protein
VRKYSVLERVLLLGRQLGGMEEVMSSSNVQMIDAMIEAGM